MGMGSHTICNLTFGGGGVGDEPLFVVYYPVLDEFFSVLGFLPGAKVV